jgi:hypothetical protein
MSENYKIKTLKNQKNKHIAIALMIILMFSTLMATLPAVNAQKTNITLAVTLYPIIGQNSPTLITWMPTPNPFNPGGTYEVQNEVNSPRWANATITFTRPDGSKDNLTGPFTVYKLVYGSGSVGFNPRFEIIYTPNVQGNWTVTFSWPGDDTYNPTTATNTFTVGPHFDKRTSWCLLSIRPYPAAGINQEVLVNAFITPPPMSSYENFKDIKFTIRRGDFSIYTDFSMDSEAPGVLWYSIYPDKVGNWSIAMSWAGSYFYKPCSITRYFTVQEAQIPYPVPDTPLPTVSWTFPVNVYNREWRNIAGPWLQPGYNASIGSSNQYTEAPRTAHIAWKIPPVIGAGGYIGSTDQSNGITTSNIYASTAASISCIMAGRGYYAAGGTIYCVDIRTGQTLWTAPGNAMSKFGLPSGLVGATRSRAPVLYYFGTNSFIIYDALTGAVTLNTTGMPMLLYNDPYVYSVSGNNWIKWTTAGTSTNFASRIIWNISDPYIAFPWSPATWPWNYVIADGLIVYQLQRYGRVTYEDAVMEYQVARNETTGELVYAKQILDPTNPDTWTLQQGPSRAAGYGLYYYQVTGIPAQMGTNPNALTTGGYIAWKIKDGTLAWTSEPFKTYPWGCFHSYNPLANGYGMIFDLSYAGVYALNATNGKVVWEYHPGDSGMETPYNSWPFGSVGSVVGGGVLFAPETEHSPTLYYRGNTMKAIDVFTGKELWDIMGYYTPTAIAYGTLMAQDAPNGYTYAFAKGQTATTVSAQNDVYTKGSSILIKGTVTDQSPAQKGTAAVSDDSMTDWMEYLHMQQPKPTNTKGIPVKLTAVDQGGKSTDIGTVWTDSDGFFKKLWTPTVEGEYAIVATFTGSLSYYSSYAKTVVGVAAATAAASPAPSASVAPSSSPETSSSPAASSTPTSTSSPSASSSPTVAPTQVPPPTESSPMNWYIVVAAVVVIAAVVAAAVLLKKRQQK